MLWAGSKGKSKPETASRRRAASLSPSRSCAANAAFFAFRALLSCSLCLAVATSPLFASCFTRCSTMATETTSPSLHPIPTLSFGAFFFSLLSGEADADEAGPLWLGRPRRGCCSAARESELATATARPPAASSAEGRLRARRGEWDVFWLSVAACSAAAAMAAVLLLLPPPSSPPSCVRSSAPSCCAARGARGGASCRWGCAIIARCLAPHPLSPAPPNPNRPLHSARAAPETA